MKTINNDGGFVLIVALLIMVVLTVIGIVATNTSVLELKISGNDRVHKRALYQAEAGAILATEVVEKNIQCLTGFAKTGAVSGVDVADLDATTRVWSRTTNARNGLAMYLDPKPWTADICTPTDINTPNVSYPINNLATAVELTDVYLGGHVAMLPGGSLVMAAGYERAGKSSAAGGTERNYDIISRHRGVDNSQSTVVFGWRHVINSPTATVPGYCP